MDTILRLAIIKPILFSVCFSLPRPQATHAYFVEQKTSSKEMYKFIQVDLCHNLPGPSWRQVAVL